MKKFGGQIMKRAIAFALLLGAVGVCGGCSNTLTESSAVSMFQKYFEDNQNDEQRKLGHPVVDRCDHLLLVTETVAKAQCMVHMSLTKDGATKLGNAPPPGLIYVDFGKQPDGRWVVTGLHPNP
jgi:hypothetical protein